MSSDTVPSAGPAGDLATGVWALDPERSAVEFRSRTLYGLIGVKGRFGRYRGSLDLGARPAIELTIEADSVDTGHGRRDEHLRSADFFDVAAHPRLGFVAEAATLDGETLRTSGTLWAAGGSMPLEIAATVRPVGTEFEIEARARVDQHGLGMDWNPLRMMRPTALLVRGRLVRG
ncbi:MAG: YceI family protein [Solirubrobacterales bacterium]